MGKAQRDALYRGTASPGPGTYELCGRITGPKFCFAGRHSQSTANLAPGPGQYDPDVRARFAQTTFRFSMPGRPASARDGRRGPPGPGSYEILSARQWAGGRFGKDARNPLSNVYTRYVPGPGAYDSGIRLGSFKLVAPKYT